MIPEVLPELSFPERMKIIIDHAGSAEKLAKRACMSARVIGKYLSGESEPSRVRLIDLAIAGGVNTRWLAEGFGPVERGAMDIPPGWNEGVYPLAETQGGQGYVHVPRYDIAASAGGGAMVHSEQVVDYLAFRPEWVQDSLRVDPKHLALISVTGDSMEPTLTNGDLVLVDISDRRIAANDIYVVQFMGALLVKRIQAHLDGSVSVISDNKIYETEIIKGDMLDRLNVIGRVVWYGRRA